MDCCCCFKCRLSFSVWPKKSFSAWQVYLSMVSWSFFYKLSAQYSSSVFQLCPCNNWFKSCFPSILSKLELVYEVWCPRTLFFLSTPIPVFIYKSLSWAFQNRHQTIYHGVTDVIFESLFHFFQGNTTGEEHFQSLHNQTRTYIQETLWHKEDEIWYDYSISDRTLHRKFYPSNIFPMVVGCYDSTEKSYLDTQILQYLKVSYFSQGNFSKKRCDFNL